MSDSDIPNAVVTTNEPLNAGDQPLNQPPVIEHSEPEAVQEATLADLQQTAISLGMTPEDASTFTVRAPLIATINTLRAAKATQNMTPSIDPIEERRIDKQWSTKADNMRRMLEKQPKVRILVPCEGKEKPGIVNWRVNRQTGIREQEYVSGAYQTVILNGYTYIIPKGIYVEVPQQIADQIQEKYQQTAAAGQGLSLDRIDPQTGKPVRDQLS